MDNNFLDNDVPEQFRNVFVNKASAKLDKVNLAGDNKSCSAENSNKGEQAMENETKPTQVVPNEPAKSSDNTVKELNDKIVALEAEKASLATEVENLSTAKKSLEEENESLKQSKSELEKANTDLTSEKESAVAECETVKQELASIKKEQLVASRKNELAEAGLLISDETLQSKQIAKISDLSDEQFADYVSELKAIAGSKETKPEPIGTKGATKEGDGVEHSETKASVKAPLSDGEIYTQAISSVQAPSSNEESVDKYAMM